MRHRMWLWTECMQQIDHKLQQQKQTDEKKTNKKQSRAVRSIHLWFRVARIVLLGAPHKLLFCFSSEYCSFISFYLVAVKTNERGNVAFKEFSADFFFSTLLSLGLCACVSDFSLFCLFNAQIPLRVHCVYVCVCLCALYMVYAVLCMLKPLPVSMWVCLC